MATYTTTTRLRHDSDANFREWGSEFSAALAAIGLIQTADTGQINWTTVTRAATNSEAGHEIWRFSDASHSTSPLFIRVGYGTGTSANTPRIQISIGSGSNGSGSLTGTYAGATTVGDATSTRTSDTAVPSYWCYTDGFFGFRWKAGSHECCFVMARTVDSTGAATPDGFFASWGGTSSSGTSVVRRQAWKITSPTYTGANNTGAQGCGMCLAPLGLDIGGDSGGTYVYTAWIPQPRPVPVVGVIGVHNSACSPGDTLSAATVGTTARQYLVLPNQAGAAGFVAVTDGSGAGLRMAMLWQ